MTKPIRFANRLIKLQDIAKIYKQMILFQIYIEEKTGELFSEDPLTGELKRVPRQALYDLILEKRTQLKLNLKPGATRDYVDATISVVGKKLYENGQDKKVIIKTLPAQFGELEV